MEPATKRRKVADDQNLSEEVVTEVAAGQDKRQSLFVRSLPASVTKERLIEHFSQSYPLKHATVVLDPTTKISRGFGFVTFTDAEDASRALAEFNNSVLDGRKIKVEAAEARNRETADKVDGKASSRNVKGEELRAKRQQDQQDNLPPKLIVRNLPWSIKTAEDLSKLFLSYGKVKHAVVPRLPANKDVQAGFGIVILRGKKNAERALQGINGKEVDGRTLAVDWAVDKETWAKTQQADRQQESLATDNVLPIDEQTVPGEEDLDDDQADEPDADDNLSDGVVESESEHGIDEEQGGADLDADDISDLAADSDSESGDQADKFKTQDTTVFIRNLPYDTDDETLFDHFTTNFGPVRYARVVFDHETERPRGTAFVCFRHETDAKECVRNCPKQEPVNTDTRRGKPQQNFSSVLQNSASDSSGKYTLDSRVLNVTRALPKPEADRRADESKSSRTAKQQGDKRKLYLLSEGTVGPGSSLYNTLSKAELDIRSSSAKQRQKLVKSNPNLGLSMTRLSVRNLPRFIDGRALKALAREAIVGFAGDVKTGLRNPISKEELARDGEVGREAEKKRKEAGKGVVRQAKVVYESDVSGTKVGEGKGGRSRGYGFIEYWGHRSALMGLRWLNGHLVKRPKDAKGPDDGEKGKRLIVEFAIENAQVVQRRGDREVRDRGRREREGQEDGEDDNRKRKDSKGGNKRKRDDRDDGQRPNNKRPRDNQNGNRGDKKPRDNKAGKEVKLDAADQDEKNKVAARNRIIAQKRQKRKGRK